MPPEYWTSNSATASGHALTITAPNGFSSERLSFRENGIPAGGRFTAVATGTAPDGGQLWTIRDVPFFAELSEGVRANDKPIGREWMLAAIEKHRQLEADQGHVPPVHENHNDSPNGNRLLGFLRPKYVDRVIIDGRKAWATFGDICGVSTADLQKIENLEFPYRSVEVHRSWRPEFSSLALLSTEAPHFKLPMLTISQRVEQMVLPEESRPALAACGAGDSDFLLFSFSGVSRMAKKKTAPDKPEKLSENESIEETVRRVLGETLPAMLREAMNSESAAETETEEEETATDAAENRLPVEIDGPAAFNEESSETLTEEGSDRLAAMQGEIAALKAKEAARDRVTSIENAVADACDSLREDGWEVPEASIAAMRESAEGHPNPKKAIDAFAASFRTYAPKEPAATLEEALGETPGEGEPEELAKFAEQGPEALAAARALTTQWREMKENFGEGFESDLETYIDANLEHEMAHA